MTNDKLKTFSITVKDIIRTEYVVKAYGEDDAMWDLDRHLRSNNPEDNTDSIICKGRGNAGRSEFDILEDVEECSDERFEE